MDLFIEALEGGIYLVKDSQGLPLKDQYQQNLRFTSLTSIREHFQDCHLDKVWLQNSSPYDEMCGLGDASPQPPMELHW